jgi:hypothetical protein
MNALKIIRQYASLKSFINKTNIDCFADRLSHSHTTFLILMCISFTTLRHLKSTIDCWIPKELKRYEVYMTKLCWLKGTYYLPIDSFGNVIDEKLYNESEEFKKEALITYYQWIIIIMLLQACFFYLPYVLWSFIANRSGYELTNMMCATAKYDNYDCQQDRVVLYLASCFKRYKFNFNNFKLNASGKTVVNARDIFFKIHLHLSYLFVKILYLVNSMSQMMLINYFLTNSTYKFDAIGLLGQMLKGTNVQETAVFPIIVQCDLNIAHDLVGKGDSHFYSIRCVLSLNMFVEKIYVFLWLWCLIVTIFTFIDLIRWSLKFILINGNYRFVKNRLRINNLCKFESENDKYLLRIFVNEYLARDGIFILRLIEKNAGLLVSNDLIVQLWADFFKEMENLVKKSNV